MNQYQWDSIVNPPPKFRATIVVEDGTRTEEITTSPTKKLAQIHLQPGWSKRITVVKLEPY